MLEALRRNFWSQTQNSTDMYWPMLVPLWTEQEQIHHHENQENQSSTQISPNTLSFCNSRVKTICDSLKKLVCWGYSKMQTLPFGDYLSWKSGVVWYEWARCVSPAMDFFVMGLPTSEPQLMIKSGVTKAQFRLHAEGFECEQRHSAAGWLWIMGGRHGRGQIYQRIFQSLT